MPGACSPARPPPSLPQSSPPPGYLNRRSQPFSVQCEGQHCQNWIARPEIGADNSTTFQFQTSVERQRFETWFRYHKTKYARPEAPRPHGPLPTRAVEEIPQPPERARGQSANFTSQNSHIAMYNMVRKCWADPARGNPCEIGQRIPKTPRWPGLKEFPHRKFFQNLAFLLGNCRPSSAMTFLQVFPERRPFRGGSAKDTAGMERGLSFVGRAHPATPPRIARCRGVLCFRKSSWRAGRGQGTTIYFSAGWSQLAPS